MFKNYRKIYSYLLLVLLVLPSSLGAQSLKTSWDSSAIIEMINATVAIKKTYPDSVLALFYQIFEKSKATGYVDGMGIVLSEIALTYNSINKYDSAIHYNKMALFFCSQSSRNQHRIPGIYSNIGFSYYIKGDYTNAILYFDSSVKEGLKLNLPKERRHLAITLNNLAGIHVILKQPVKALSFLNQAEEICRKGNFAEQLVITLNNKADAYSSMGENKKAESYYTEAIDLAKQFDDIESITSLIYAMSGLAELKLKLGHPKEALKLLNEIETTGTKNKWYYKNYSYINPIFLKGSAYLQLGDYAKAEQFLNKSLEESLALQVKDNRIRIYKALAQLYDSTQQYKKALQHFYIYEQLKDSLLSKEKARDINEIDTRYRTAEKDRDIAQKELLINKQQNQLTQRNIWIGGISLGALLLGVLFVSRYKINKQKQESQAKQIRILQQQHDIFTREQEIDHLKAMIEGEEKERIRIARELHDGIVSQLLAVRLHFNGTLENKKGKILQPQDFSNTLHYLDEATKELRATAHNLMPETVLQNGLIIALQTYCSKISELSGIDIEFQQVGREHKLHPDKALSVYRIVQELIQNALKHAHATHIFVLLIFKDSLLTLTVEDDGIGYNTNELSQTTGMGLKNIITRIKAMKGTIDFSSEKDKGTTVHCEIIYG